jgi:Domain of unknown function (DUF4136)
MSNRYLFRTAAAGALGLSVAACTSLPVTTDVNPNMSVTNCHTYTFAPEHVANGYQPAAYGNPLNAERLRNAIAANLAARGIQAVPTGAAECVVGYAMGTRQVFNDWYGGGGYGWGWGYGGGYRGGYYGGGWGWDGPYVRDETRIAVDLFDAKSRTPIWHASVSQYVSDMTGPNAEAKINEGTAAIFAKFPVALPVAAAAGSPTKT